MVVVAVLARVVWAVKLFKWYQIRKGRGLNCNPTRYTPLPGIRIISTKPADTVFSRLRKGEQVRLQTGIGRLGTNTANSVYLRDIPTIC